MVFLCVDVCSSVYSGGTAGPAVAARLAEDSNVKVLMIEAGTDSTDMENVQMTGG